MSVLPYVCTTGTRIKHLAKSLYGKFTRILPAILVVAPDKTTAIRPLASHLSNHPRKWSKISRALLMKLGQTRRQRSPIDSSVLADHQNLTSISFVRTLGSISRTYPARWPVGTDDERESKESMMSACISDNYDSLCLCDKLKEKFSLRIWNNGHLNL